MSLFAVVAVAAFCTIVGAATAGQLKTFYLPSPLIDTSTPGGHLEGGRTVPKVNVVLPEGYDRRSKRGYPVLYLLHGGTGGADTWQPHLPEQFDRFKGIVVMPDAGTFGMYVNWWNGGARSKPAWASYHLGPLRRAIESRYRIRPGRRWHALGGNSMGAQGAMRYASMLPGYFGTVAGYSTAVPDMQSDVAQLGIGLLAGVGGDPGVKYGAMFGPADGYWAEGNSPQQLAPNLGHTRVFLSSGDGINCPDDPVVRESVASDTVVETFVHSQQQPFADALTAAGAQVNYQPACGIHSWPVFIRAMLKSRTWGFFGPVTEHPRKWTYRTVASSGEMWGFLFRFKPAPTALTEFRRSGKQLTASGNGRVHLRGGKCHLVLVLPFSIKLGRTCNRVGTA